MKHEKNVGEILKEVMPQDFIKFGLIPEFIGRVPVVVSLEHWMRMHWYESFRSRRILW